MILLPSELSAFGSLCNQSSGAYQHSISLRKTIAGGRVFPFAKSQERPYFAGDEKGVFHGKSMAYRSIVPSMGC